jgi:uridine kinase
MTTVSPTEPPSLALSRLPAARRALVEALAAEIRTHYARGRRIVALDAAEPRADLDAFAADLGLALQAAGDSVFQAEAADFRDDEQLVRALLDPFRLGGSTGFVLAAWDAGRDADRIQEWTTGPADAVLLLAGSRLQRPSVRGRWSYTIWVDLAGEAGAAASIADDYRDAVRPREAATAVVDLRIPDEPRRLYLDYCAL